MDRHEFARQYQAAFRSLWLIAAGVVGDRVAADDIVQEAAVIAFRKLDGFQNGTSFLAWAGQIVRYCAANYKRKSVGRKTLAIAPDKLDQRPMATESRAFNSFGGRQEMQSAFDDRMLQGLERLTVEARTCLLLRVVDELSYTEIAELTGIPPGTAMSHVHRGKKQLRLAYEGEVGGEGRAND